MSHTNSTANYNLPQFVGTDTPAWLTDVNGAMTAIDSQMKTNADSASTANASATTANSNIGTLANLNTTAKTNLVSAVNEVNTNLGTVSGVASSASGSANQANNAIEALTKYLDIVNFNEKTPVASGGAINFHKVYCATNASGTLGKIYGFFSVNCNNASGGTITIPTEFRPTETIVVYGIVLKQRTDTAGNTVFSTPITINTNGNAVITMPTGDYNTTNYYNLIASLIFAKNFGDTPMEG